jgi:hypothetical protein
LTEVSNGSAEDRPVPAWATPYAFELRFQASAARQAFNDLESDLNRRKELAERVRRGLEEGPHPLLLEREAQVATALEFGNVIGPILGDVQAFLSALGIVEAILWPSAAKSRGESVENVTRRVERGRSLRALFGVPEDSPLQTRNRGTDDARGGLLHYDEMLDDWIRAHPGEEYTPIAVGSVTQGTAERRETALRWLDEDSHELRVGDRARNLKSALDALAAAVGHIQISANLTGLRGPGPKRANPPPPSTILAVTIPKQSVAK